MGHSGSDPGAIGIAFDEIVFYPGNTNVTEITGQGSVFIHIFGKLPFRFPAGRSIPGFCNPARIIRPGQEDHILDPVAEEDFNLVFLCDPEGSQLVKGPVHQCSLRTVIGIDADKENGAQSEKEKVEDKFLAEGNILHRKFLIFGW
jgi:hypothetical protein